MFHQMVSTLLQIGPIKPCGFRGQIQGGGGGGGVQEVQTPSFWRKFKWLDSLLFNPGPLLKKFLDLPPGFAGQTAVNSLD